ncbi:transketolase [Candidatus Peregrinibacteria bacterium]|nr:transketolase [Candidatus Peregrinibacteria bacterium]
MNLEAKAAQIRLDTLMSIYKAGRGHTGSCMSVVDILVALYYGDLSGKPVMKFDPARPGSDTQDYLILSKGQAVPAQYAILADLGFFDKAELDYLGKPGALLQERPHVKIPGVAASMSAYGQGLSVALGLALATAVDKRSNRVFTVLGDGELQCGQVWEAAMAASQYKLNNLIAFVDNNKVQSDGMISTVMNVEPIQQKFEAFGWQVIQVLNGHNYDDLLDALAKAFYVVRKPVCLWCHTVAGKGVEFAERKASYLAAVLSEGEMNDVIPKLKSLYDAYAGKEI